MIEIKNLESKKIIDSFIQQYIETALWSSFDDNCEPLDDIYTIDDISLDTLTRIIIDCNEFRMYASNLINELDETCVAHDFWLTRNNHGAGFWDGDYDTDIGNQLTELSKQFGEFYLYIGDDNTIYHY